MLNWLRHVFRILKRVGVRVQNAEMLGALVQNAEEKHLYAALKWSPSGRKRWGKPRETLRTTI